MSKLGLKSARLRAQIEKLLQAPVHEGVEFDLALYKSVVELASVDDLFRRQMRENADETLRNMGLKQRVGVRYIGASVGDRVIPLPRCGELERRFEDPDDPPPEVPPDEEVGEPDPGQVTTRLVTIEVSHNSTSVFPQGYRGDDTFTVTLPAGVQVAFAIVAKNFGGMSDAILSGQSRSGDKFTLNVHWWCNGWQPLSYTAKVFTYDAQQRKYGHVNFDLFNSTVAPVRLGAAPIELLSWWDDPTRYW